MQVKMTNNNVFCVQNSVSPKNSLRAKSAKTKMQDSFGAQCKVTISGEGKKLSKHTGSGQKQSGMTRRSAEEAKIDKMMLRQQEESEDYKDTYSDVLDELKKLMKSAYNSNISEEDKNSIKEKQKVLRDMQNAKAKQEEENRQRVREAMDALSLNSKQQEVDEKNSDLYVILKSIEEREKREEEQDGSASTDNQESTAESGGIGGQLMESASMLGVSAATRELKTLESIESLRSEGDMLLSKYNSMMHEAYEGINAAIKAMDEAGLSDEDKKVYVSDAIGRAESLVHDRLGQIDDSGVKRKAIQKYKDAREMQLKHIEINPLSGVKEAQNAIVNASVDAVFKEASQDMLDKASKELADRVQEEIDKRNDITDKDETDKEESVKEESAKEESVKEENISNKDILEEINLQLQKEQTEDK